MHWPTFAWTQDRTRTRSRRTAWAALKNWLTRHRTSRHGTCRCSRLSGRRRWPGWRLVHRPRPRLGDDHARRRRMRNWTRWFRCHWSRRLHSWRRCERSWRRGLGHRRRRSRRINRTRRHWHRRVRGSRRLGLGHRRRWSGKCRPQARRRNDDPRRRNRCGSGRRGRGSRGQCCWPRGGGWTGRGSSYAHRSLLLTNRIQNVAWPGNIGEIDLGLNLIAINAGGTQLFRRGLRFAGSAQIKAHLLRFVLFHGAGVRLLLSDAYFRKRIENRFAFNFQLPGQIVNSNLAHPPFLSSGLSR